MSQRTTQRSTTEKSSSSAIKMDVQLRKLFHRPGLIGQLLILREQASLAALTARERDSGGFFSPALDAGVVAKGRQVLQQRIDRLQGPPDIATLPEAPEAKASVQIWNRGKFIEQTLQLRQSGLAPFALAAARLFEPDLAAERVNASELVGMPLRAFGEYVKELSERDNAASCLVEAAAALLLYAPGARDERVRRTRALMLLDNATFTRDAVAGLRGMADAFWLLRRPDEEFAALQMITMLGDSSFVADRYDRLALPTTLALVPLEPASLVWKDGRFQPIKSIVYDAELVVVDGMLPSLMLDALPEHALLTPRSLVKRQLEWSSLVATFCGPYSMGESILSLRTEQLAQRMCDAFARPFENTPLAPLVPLLRESSIRVDDVLFNALLPLFSLNIALESGKPKSVALITDQLSFANQAALAVARILPDCVIHACVLRPGDGVSEDAGHEELTPVTEVVSETINFLQKKNLQEDAIDTTPLQPSHSSTLFSGRPFDRNYITDLKVFAPLSTATGETHLLVTAPSRMKDGRIATLSDVMPDSRDLKVWDSAETLSRTLAGRAVPESLKDHGANVVTSFLERVHL